MSLQSVRSDGTDSVLLVDIHADGRLEVVKGCTSTGPRDVETLHNKLG